MSQSREFLFQDRMRGTWLAACLAGLPHLGYALTRYVPSLLVQAHINGVDALAEWLYLFMQSFPLAWWLLTRLAPADYWSGPRTFVEAGNWVFAASALILALFAWRRSWPRWSATILGYLLVVLFETSLMIWRDDQLTSFSAGIVLIAYALIIVWLARRDPLAGLLSLVPLYPMYIWLLAMDGVRGTYGEGIFYIFIGLVMGLVVGWILRRDSLAIGLGALLVTILVLGLGVGYAMVYHSNMLAPPQPISWAVLRSALGALLAFALIGLPLWLTLGWGWARRRSAAA